MPVSGSKRARKADREKSRKNHVGAGKRWSIGACKAVSIVFNTSFWCINSWYTLWLVNCDSLLKHLHCTLIIILVLHTQSLTNILSIWNPPLLHLWHFEMVTGSGFGSWRIEVFEKMLTGSLLLSSRHFLLIRSFTACSLFSLIFPDRESGTGYLYSKFQTKNAQFLHITEFGTYSK